MGLELFCGSECFRLPARGSDQELQRFAHGDVVIDHKDGAWSVYVAATSQRLRLLALSTAERAVHNIGHHTYSLADRTSQDLGLDTRHWGTAGVRHCESASLSGKPSSGPGRHSIGCPQYPDRVGPPPLARRELSLPPHSPIDMEALPAE